MFKFDLGDKVRDVITSYSGVITCRSEFMNGCIRYGVQQQKVGKDGKVQDAEWFDEKQLEPVKKKAVKIQTARTGGPAPTPKLMADAR